MLDYEKLCICKSLARTFQYAVTSEYDLRTFIEKTLRTEVFADFAEDYTLYPQSGSYIFARIKEELSRKNSSLFPAAEFQNRCKPFFEETAYWIGYLFQYWRFLENISPTEMTKYDIEEIIYSYDPLHTQSIKYAIDWIKQEYRIE